MSSRKARPYLLLGILSLTCLQFISACGGESGSNGEQDLPNPGDVLPDSGSCVDACVDIVERLQTCLGTCWSFQGMEAQNRFSAALTQCKLTCVQGSSDEKQLLLEELSGLALLDCDDYWNLVRRGLEESEGSISDVNQYCSNACKEFVACSSECGESNQCIGDCLVQGGCCPICNTKQFEACHRQICGLELQLSGQKRVTIQVDQAEISMVKKNGDTWDLSFSFPDLVGLSVEAQLVKMAAEGVTSITAQPDVFILLELNGIPIWKTYSVSDTLQPVWVNMLTSFNANVDDIVSLSVWDDDTGIGIGSIIDKPDSIGKQSWSLGQLTGKMLSPSSSPLRLQDVGLAQTVDIAISMTEAMPVEYGLQDGNCFSACPTDPDCFYQFLGEVQDNLTQAAVGGAVVDHLDNATGIATGYSAITDSTGQFQLQIPRSCSPLSGFKVSADFFKDTYQFGILSAAVQETLWAVSIPAFEQTAVLAGFEPDPSHGTVAGVVYWMSDSGEELPVGCAKIVSDVGGDPRYFSEITGLPRSLSEVESTGLGKAGGRFLIGKVPPGPVSIRAHFGDDPNDESKVVGESSFFVFPDSLSIQNIWVDKSAFPDKNPTPADCQYRDTSF